MLVEVIQPFRGLMPGQYQLTTHFKGVSFREAGEHRGIRFDTTMTHACYTLGLETGYLRVVPTGETNPFSQPGLAITVSEAGIKALVGTNVIAERGRLGHA